MVQLMAMAVGDFAIIWPPPSKADQFALHWGKSSYLLALRRRGIDQCGSCAHRDLCEAFPCCDAQRCATPLFADDAGRPFVASFLDRFFAHALRIISPGRAVVLSWHSWRIYLARALRAAGMSDANIQSLLRWKSVVSLHIYARPNPEVSGAWLTRAARSATLPPCRPRVYPCSAPATLAMVIVDRVSVRLAAGDRDQDHGV